MAPLRERVRTYLDDPAELDRVLARGATRAREVAGATLAAVHEKIGFLPPTGWGDAAWPHARRPGRRRGPTPRSERDRAKPSKFEQLRARYEWLDHLVRAGTRYTERHGDHYAAAITFFSVLSLVPLLMIGFAVAGYVLFFNPALLDGAAGRRSPRTCPPGWPRRSTRSSTRRSTSAAPSALFGLLGALYSGIGWMSNLREALSEQWAQVPEAPAMLKRLLFDLLGAGRARPRAGRLVRDHRARRPGSPRTVLSSSGSPTQGWAQVLLGVLGVLLGLVANWLIFLWVIARLPREHATLRSAAKAALFGAVGFEVLKQVMTYLPGAA